MIFNIQKCSIHDGEGLRTLVFFKGCPLKCPWCANPESQSFEKEIMETMSKCIGCGMCVKVCPEGAIENGKINREKCTKCMKCLDVCYAEAKRVAGTEYTIEELYALIEKDKPFYSLFGGGVTFSGGEPLAHPEYLTEIARHCKQKGISVMLESCGMGNFDKFKEALPYIDGMFMDIKIIDDEEHRKVTGAGNKLILDNICRICEAGIPVTIRTPIVPGYTDSEENIRGIAQFIKTLPGVKEYELLAYHRFGESKYTSLGISYPLEGVETPSDETMQNLVNFAGEILKDTQVECFWTKNNNKEYAK